jgi:hypothetical protein
VLAVLLAVAVAGATSGCESAVDRFRGELQPLRKQALTQRAQLAAVLRTVRLHNRADATRVNQQIEALARTFGKMDHVKAPGGQRQAYAGYRAANARLIADLRQFSSTLASGSSSQLTQIGTQAQDAVGAIQRAEDALDNTLRSS